jgi:hypothetical protein
MPPRIQPPSASTRPDSTPSNDPSAPSSAKDNVARSDQRHRDGLSTLLQPLKARRDESRTKAAPQSASTGGRPTTTGFHIVGIGKSRSTDQPGRFDAGTDDSPIRETPYSAPLDQGAALAQHLEAAPHALGELPASNQRPQRSLGMSALLKLPGASRVFKPSTPHELIGQSSAYRMDPRAKLAARSDVEVNPQATAKLLEDLTQRLRDSESRCADALREPDHDAPSDASSAARREAIQQVREDLALLDPSFHVMALDMLERKIVGRKTDVVHDQVEQLKKAVPDDERELTHVIEQLTRQNATLAEEYLPLSSLQKKVRDLERAIRVQTEAPAMHRAAAANTNRNRPDVGELEVQLSAARQQLAMLEPEARANRDVRNYLHTEIDRMSQFKLASHTRFGEVTQNLDIAGKQVEATKTDNAAALTTKQELANALSDVQTRAVASAAPGFELAALARGGAPLIGTLRQMAATLPEDDVDAERALPRAAAMDMISRALALTVGPDNVEAADRLAQELISRPLNHWVPLPADANAEAHAEAAPYHAPSEQMQRLMSMMAAVPRGLDALDAVAGSTPSSDSNATHLQPEQRNALQAYLQADQARQLETDSSVKHWLGEAMDVAAHAVRNTKETVLFETDGIAPKKRAAYRAVCNGFLSNAPGSDYGRCNQQLLDLTGALDAHKPQQRGPMRWLPHVVKPAQTASPFAPQALRYAQKQMEAQGMGTRKTQAEADLKAIFDDLESKARSYLEQLPAPAPGGRDRRPTDDAERRFAAAVAALGEYVTTEPRKPGRSLRFPVSPRSLNYRSPLAPRTFAQTRRLYDAHLGAKEVEQIRERFGRLLSATTVDERGAPASGEAPRLPAALETLFAQRRASMVEVLCALRKAMDDAPRVIQTELGSTLANAEDIEQRIDKARSLDLKSADDIDAFFRPMLETARLRDQVTWTNGVERGGGLQTPVSPLFPLAGKLDIASKHTGSFVQFTNPTFSSQFIVGNTEGWRHGGRVSAGYRISFGPATFNAAGVAGAAFSREQRHYTVLRILRKKNPDGSRDVTTAIDSIIDTLKIAFRWQATPDADGADGVDGDDNANARFDGPLEAIFALSPDIIVASGQKSSNTTQAQMEARTALRLRTPGHHFSVGATVIPLAVRAAKTSEQGIERTGFAHQQVEDRNQQTQQRVGVSARAGFNAKPYKHTLVAASTDRATGQHTERDTGIARVNLAVNLLEYSRELFSNLEKNGATNFTIGDAIGASADRVYGSPKDLLAEIEANHADWLMRCLDVLPRAKGAPTDTPERFAHAQQLLDRFTADLRSVGANPSFQFTIKYEMQPRMSGMIDGLRGIEALAAQQGDSVAHARARSAMNDILSYRVSWAPKNMTMRSKGKLSQETGIDFFVRWLKSASAETSRATTAFPV